MHERYLLDPTEKIVASQEIVDAIERAARTSELIRRTGVAGCGAQIDPLSATTSC